MSTAERYLTHRGEVKGAVAFEEVVAFVTLHAEGQPTPLYRLDADKLALEADPLPRGGVALAAARREARGARVHR